MGIALITGASAGLGAEFAKLFTDDGHTVILVARRLDRLNNIASALRMINAKTKVHVIEQNLAKPGAGAELFAKVRLLGLPIDFLVNNAGFGTNGKFWEIDLHKEMELIDLNMRSLVELTHLFLPQMIAQGSGKIMNVGSVAGFQPGPYMANYFASKAYVNSFSEALSEELRGTGVTCTVLAPGATATEFAAVAGLEKSRLFTSGVASSLSVVREGYRGMMSGKTVVITGWMNQILVQALRISPRSLVRKIAGFLNQAK